MTNASDMSHPVIGRRTVLAMGASGAALAAAFGDAAPTLAQAGPAPAPAAAPASPGRVVVERLDGGVLTIGIDRAEAQNRFDPAIIIGLGKAYHQLDHDEALRVGVLYGKGVDFCLGLDVPAYLAGLASGQLPVKDPDFVHPFGLVEPYRAKPLVVAVQGGTKLGGHELFLAADLRVAASDTVFSQAEVSRGAFPGGGATVRFVRDAGWANAMRYMLTGDEWGAEEARRMGLVQEIVPPGQQLERAVALAKKIAAGAPLGVRATRASAHQALSSEDAALAAISPEFRRILQSEDAKEARRAREEGRVPVFRGL
jgi:enoyl-CoA hydratase